MIKLGTPTCNYTAGEYSYSPLTNITLDNSVNKGILKDWLAKTSMPTARRYSTSSVVDGIIYAIGGANTVNVATVEAYNPVTNTWSTKTSMLTARRALTSQVVDGVIYVIGGATTVSVATVESLQFVMSDVYYTTDDTVVAIDGVPSPTAILYTEPFDIPIPAVLRFTAIPRA